MYEMVKELVSDYQNFTKTQIEIKKERYLKKIYNEAKLDEIMKLIEDEISQRNSSLMEILQKIY